MKKFKYFCNDCEIYFDVKTEDDQEAFFCPFCGKEIINTDDDLQNEDLEEDIFDEIEV